MSDTPVTWWPKDPDEAKNYSLDWAKLAMLEGDTVVASSWHDVTGVVLEAERIMPGGSATEARVSGGIDGATASLINRVTTAAGETLEQTVLLPIVANTAVAPTGYATPRPQDLVARYPAFASVPFDTLAVHILDALQGADTSWNEGDYIPAVLALAAHNMSVLGIGAQEETARYARAGVTNLRDGAFSVSFSDNHVGKASAGTYESTLYGTIYKRLLRKNKGGPRITRGGAVGGWGPLAQQNDGTILPWGY
jgi:hypothetical protein